MAAATTTSSRCDANVGPWQATIAITSECAHTFNLRFVSGGSAACPSCAAASKDAPATATNSSSNLSGETGLFGKQQATPPKTNAFGLGRSPSPCSACGGAMGRGEATVTSECAHTFHLRCFSFSGSVCPACRARWRYEVTVKPSSTSSSSDPFLSPSQPSLFSKPVGSTFAAPNKWAIPSSTPSFLSQPSPSSSAPEPSPSSAPSFSFGQPFSSSSSPPRSSMSPQAFTRAHHSSALPMPSLISRSAGSTFTAASTSSSSTPTARRASSVFSQPTDSSFNATLQSAPPAFGSPTTPAFS